MLVPAYITSVIHQLAVIDLDESAPVLEVAITNYKLFERMGKAALVSVPTALVCV